jgi:hypothetical protein
MEPPSGSLEEGGSDWLECGMAIVKLQRVMTSCETRSRGCPPGG